MSDTKTDFAKVTQLLDGHWWVHLYKNNMGSYTAIAVNKDQKQIFTDDFTPEQALTRLAYKVIDAEIL